MLLSLRSCFSLSLLLSSFFSFLFEASYLCLVCTDLMDTTDTGPPSTFYSIPLSQRLFEDSSSEKLNQRILSATEHKPSRHELGNKQFFRCHQRYINNRPVQPIFHPDLYPTKNVIRKPGWLSGAAQGEMLSHRGSLSSMALFGVLFANCIGGGYGFETSIGSAGPLITLIVCALLPWIWCFPTGLAVSELSTAVKSNSGVLMWANAAFPPFISFLCILATIFIIFIGNATYPNLTAEYFSNLIDLTNWQLTLIKIGVVGLCGFMNCVGVEVVGTSTVVLCVICMAPFVLLIVIQLFGHGFNEAILHVDLGAVNWASFFSIISWNYANIENAGAVVEEVADPQTSMPKAMVMLMFSSYAAYVMPMLAGVSGLGMNQNFNNWIAGYWPEVAQVIAGSWLKYFLFVGAIFSGFGFTMTSLCCSSRLLAGIGTMRIFPKKVSRVLGYYHPRLGTPIVAIILNSVVTLVFSITMNFSSVVALCQSLYCLRMLLIYAAVVKLRIQYPDLPRPFKIPFGTVGTILFLLPAGIFSIFAAVVSSMVGIGISLAMVGFVVFGCLISWLYCRFVAKNGFQGSIVHCWDVENEESDNLDLDAEKKEAFFKGDAASFFEEPIADVEIEERRETLEWGVEDGERYGEKPISRWGRGGTDPRSRVLHSPTVEVTLENAQKGEEGLTHGGLRTSHTSDLNDSGSGISGVRCHSFGNVSEKNSGLRRRKHENDITAFRHEWGNSNTDDESTSEEHYEG